MQVEHQTFKEVPARTDMIILLQDRSVRGDPFLCDAGQRPLVELAFASYAFCLRVPEMCWPGRITMLQFADQIAKVYDCDTPGVNKLVVRALRSVHDLMVVAAVEGRMLRVAA